MGLRPIQGMALVVLAMAIIGLIDNFVAFIAAEIGLWQFHLMRSSVLCVMIFILARIFGWRLRPVNAGAVILRSFFFSTSMVLYFGALGGLSVAQAGAGLFSSPIFVLLISALFLGTRIGIWRIFAVALGFAGVLIILRPDPQTLSPLIALPVLAGLFYALNGIATLRWCARESTGALLIGVFAGLGLWGALGTVVLLIFPGLSSGTGDFLFFTRGWVSPPPAIYGWLAVQVVGSLIAVGLLTRGYQSAEVSFVTVFEYSFLIFAGFWTFVIFGTRPDTLALVGIVFIIVSGMIITLRVRSNVGP